MVRSFFSIAFNKSSNLLSVNKTYSCINEIVAEGALLQKKNRFCVIFLKLNFITPWQITQTLTDSQTVANEISSKSLIYRHAPVCMINCMFLYHESLFSKFQKFKFHLLIGWEYRCIWRGGKLNPQSVCV